MMLVRLLLHAFGPFTDAQIDFAADGAASGRLHLVYGPNEAGKSSALRAMTDLRFGIPPRSPDNFLHAYGDMRIAGEFIDDEGKRLGLVRHKGRKATLSRYDSAIGDPGAAQEAGAELEAALTGGLDRAGFEAMFGLNHARLREGGDRLIRGEGELGAALFEASAGTRDIAAILKSLEEDAKAYHSPRAKQARINEARRGLELHRKTWKQSLIRPADWQSLYRDHQRASEALADIGKGLEAARRRDIELTELRTVAPLLQDCDRTAAQLQALADAPDLAEDARETRLAAQQALRQAERDAESAELELRGCAEALEGLVIEAPLLEHADAIERLAAGVDALERSRVEVRRHQADIDQLSAELDATAVRLAPGRPLPEITALVPSEADRSALNAHLEGINRLRERLDALRGRARVLETSLNRLSAEPSAVPDPALQRHLSDAVRTARGLGDAPQRLEQMEREIQELAESQDQAISDLGADSAEALRLCRPLLQTRIDAARESLAAMEETKRELEDEDRRLQTDLDQQELRKRGLSAAGEIVTAETLRQARERRDLGWSLILRAYVERDADPDDLARDFDAGRSLPEAFEAALEDADRQADLLRADAQRAANYQQCVERIAQMAERRGRIGEELEGLSARREAALSEWFGQLDRAALPRLPPDALREWQGRREAALELAGRLQRLRRERQRLEDRVDAARDALAQALAALQQVPGSTTLESLVEASSRCERQATARAARQRERSETERAQRLEQRQLNSEIGDAENGLREHADALRAWHERLLLDTAVDPSGIAARLEELGALQRRWAQLSETRRLQAQQRAGVEAFERQAGDLARLLGEVQPQMADDFALRLRARLKTSQRLEQERRGLEKVRGQAGRALSEARAEQERQAAVLAGLCRTAGVDSVGDLPRREAQAATKREARARMDDLRRQLDQASAKTEAQLRESLAGLDVVALEARRESCRGEIDRLEQAQAQAREEEERTRRALQAVDASDTAARAREAMESEAAAIRSALRPWARLRLAHALLREALQRFRERAQAPMVSAASAYFATMTGERYPRLVADEKDGQPVLLAEREDGVRIGVEAMSEGTADQLYLALRLAALELRRATHPRMPLVLDDVLITSDDRRAAQILRALARFAGEGQVMLFTHHRHLVELAREVLDSSVCAVHGIGDGL